MAKAVLDELARDRPKRHFTVGIFDDVTSLSLPWDRDFRPPRPAGEVQAVFFGLGSDGTVGANKNSVKIIVDATDAFVQGYFVYDSKKSGAMTVSHLRFGPEPINSTYLVSDADFVACHHFGLLERVDILDLAKDGATFLLNSPYGPLEVWDRLPGHVQAPVAGQAHPVLGHRRRPGGGRSPARQPDQHGHADVLFRPFEGIAGRRGGGPDQGRRSTRPTASGAAPSWSATSPPSTPRWPTWPQVEVPEVTAAAGPLGTLIPESAPDFVRHVTAMIMAGKGDLLPVSALPADGRFPSGTARYEKRAIAAEIPIWDPDICIDCGKCASVCPHATIRMKVFAPEALAGAPEGFLSKPFRSKDLVGHLHDDPGGPRRLHRLRGLRRRVPGEVQDRGQAQVDQYGAGGRPSRAASERTGTSSRPSRSWTAPCCPTTR